MRLALDSNVVVYWLGLVRKPQDADKVARARRLVGELLVKHPIYLPTQAFGETYNVLTKAGYPRERAREEVLSATEPFEMIAPAATTYVDAVSLAARRKWQVWDALIVRTAADASCDLLLSEDMQDGFTVDRLTIADPFAAAPHLRLAALLGG